MQLVKPSPYFTDTFRYFFKRFSSEISLRKWFLKRAGGESGEFHYPEKLSEFKKTLVFLPTDKDSALRYLRACRPFWNKANTLVVASDGLREMLLREQHPAEIVYLTQKDYRFGELEFKKIDARIAEFKPELCLFFAEPFLPALYLARHSGAVCRIGFLDNCYPFLNIGLKAAPAEEAALLQKLYGGANA